MAAQAAHVRAATNAVGGVLLSVAGAGELLGPVDIPGDTSDNDAAAAVAGIGASGPKADPGD